MDNERAWLVRRVVLSVLFLLIVAVPLYPELFGLDEVTPFAQLVAFRPQGLVVVLVLGILMLARRGWRIAAVLVMVLALTGAALTAPRQFSDPKPPPDGARVLTIMVANVLGGGADAGEVAKVIRETRPDLVSLPEAQVDVREEIRAHLQGLAYNGYTLQPSAAVESATSVLVSPTIVAGDFNATTDHADFRHALASNCRSVASLTGAGLVGTWPSDRPAVTRTQIDHVLITRQLEAGRFTTYAIEGSDHRAVVATVAVPRTG